MAKKLEEKLLCNNLSENRNLSKEARKRPIDFDSLFLQYNNDHEHRQSKCVAQNKYKSGLNLRNPITNRHSNLALAGA